MGVVEANLYSCRNFEICILVVRGEGTFNFEN